MPRKGRDLEKLVAALENLLSNSNIEVKSPDYIVGVNSGSRREVDVSLRSIVGSSEILVILETRDRTEIDDVRWIEQLAMKKEDVLASKVVAVSSAGFTEGAKNTAQRLGVSLREVNELNFDAIAEWFRVTEFRVFEQKGILQNAEVRVDEEFLEIAINRTKNINLNSPFLIHMPSGKEQSILQAWKDAVNQNPQMFEGLEPNIDPIRRTIIVDYPNPDNRYRIKTDIGDFPVKEIVFDVNLSITITLCPISEIIQYSKVDGEKISQSVRYSLNLGGKDMIFTFHKIEQTTSLVLSVEPIEKI